MYVGQTKQFPISQHWTKEHKDIAKLGHLKKSDTHWSQATKPYPTGRRRHYGRYGHGCTSFWEPH